MVTVALGGSDVTMMSLLTAELKRLACLKCSD